jgi:6-phosphofructokinase 1
LIPEIPYDIDKVMERINSRFRKDRGFVIIVIAEGAMPKHGDKSKEETGEVGYANVKYSGAAARLVDELKEAGCPYDIRSTVLGHLQRGGVPLAYDRVLATQFGVKAFEMVLEGKFGEMVSYQHPHITSVPLKEVISQHKYVEEDSDLVRNAKGVGISFGT